jgi:TRAP-type C4-dicarboxylate transport system substrate-binding protein
MRNIGDAKILWEVQKPFVAERLAKQNLLLLHCVVWPGQSIFTRRPITSFADIRGMKFRVQNPTTARLAELMGVTGVRVETVDIPQAFLTGIIDGMYTSNETTATLKGWDYVKYAYETNAWYPMNITFVNKAMFEALPEADRKAILEASRAAETRGWGMEAEQTREKTEMLRTHGVEVLPPPPALMTELRAIGDKMLAEWKTAVGPDGQRFLDEYNRRRGV